MKTTLLLALCLLLLGCPSQEPTPPLEPPQATPTVALTPKAATGQFKLRLSSGASPGWFEVTLGAQGEVDLGWDGGSIRYTLPAEANQKLQQQAADAVPLIKGMKPQSTPPYETLTYTEGDESYTFRLNTPNDGDPALRAFAEQMEALIPSRRGPQGGFAVGNLEYSDLEGGHYQLVFSAEEPKLVVQGEVAEELKGQQVLAAGTTSDAPNLQMTGPSFELTQLVAWPPAGGHWKGEGIPAGLR